MKSQRTVKISCSHKRTYVSDTIDAQENKRIGCCQTFSYKLQKTRLSRGMFTERSASCRTWLRRKETAASTSCLYTNHEGKPQVFFEENSIYMVMEKCLYDLIELAQNLYYTTTARVPRDDRMAILEQLASALTHAHACETKNIPAVVHMDVKLENIFVVQDSIRSWRAEDQAG